MNIVVCIKQVPDTQEVRLDPVTHTLKREGVKAIINPFDLYALEEGLRVKDAQGGTVTVLSMGPPQAEEALREALGFGGDAAVLLSDRAFAGADTWATALTLAKAIEKLGGGNRKGRSNALAQYGRGCSFERTKQGHRLGIRRPGVHLSC